MINKIIISGKQTGDCTVTGQNLIADVNPEYCLINLRHQTLKLLPEDYRGMETILELAKQLRAEKGIYD